MKLTEQKCVPCEGGMPALSMAEVQGLLGQVPKWSIKDGALERELKFKDFRQGMDFVNKVAALAEEENHHPDIYISYSKVRLRLYTFKVNGLSQNDFILAAKIDLLPGAG
jgi:4a-hydroxytetrahydrobiopterin dehydratase